MKIIGGMAISILMAMSRPQSILCSVRKREMLIGPGSRYGTWLLERGYSPKYGIIGTNKEGQGRLSEQIPYHGMGVEKIMAKIKGFL